MIDRLKDWLDTRKVSWTSYRKQAALFSGVLVVLSWLSPLLITPNWGIDFTGGTEIHLKFDDPLDIGELRAALEAIDIPSDAVQEVGTEEEHEFKVRIKDAEFGAAELKAELVDALRANMGEDFVADWDRDVSFSAEVGARVSIRYQGDRILPKALEPALAGISGAKVQEGREDNELVVKLPGLSAQIEKRIASTLQGRTFEVVGVDAVGPRVGASLRTQGFNAILATLGLVLLYVAFRFDLGFAPGAVVALVHDVSLTAGFFVLVQHELNLPIVGALLTIVGYSLNDTIVIYDRIRENQARYRREDLAALIDTSINETLSRTLATSTTTLLAILPFLFLGGPVIEDFVMAMIFGVIVGTYSTVFIASPAILEMEKIKPWLASLVAVDTGEEEGESEDVPEEFLSESEKRRRERERLARAQDDEDELAR
ncbi:MAG: protein translocase subunit SecF [Alphaproteobacteria bacterium]|nr:protein translocase subunit SecF [Alphaproteobacteria bacterium]